jgi:ABC-2 type transport system ATP-binding protein
MWAAIETADLSYRAGDRALVAGLDLLVPIGSVYGFVGPNGAGKTTTMRLLMGLLHPERGSVHLLGRSLASDRRHLMGKIGIFIEGPALYDHLSGRGNLELTRRLRGLPATETDRVLELVDMTGDANRKVGHYSLGMRQRLGLARSLLGWPALLLLDEPTNGLDPEGILAMRQLIREMPDRMGCTVFLSSHLLSEVEQVADHIGLLMDGRLIEQGRLRTLLSEAATLRIAIDDPARAMDVLRQHGWRPKPAGPGRIAIRLHELQGRDAVAALINSQLVQAGVMVSALAVETASLEQLYRQKMPVTADRAGARIAA